MTAAVPVEMMATKEVLAALAETTVPKVAAVEVPKAAPKAAKMVPKTATKAEVREGSPSLCVSMTSRASRAKRS